MTTRPNTYLAALVDGGGTVPPALQLFDRLLDRQFVGPARAYDGAVSGGGPASGPGRCAPATSATRG